MPDRSRDVSCDADVLMNLVASGRLDDILRVSEVRGVIGPQVLSEALFVEGDVPGTQLAVDLNPFFAANVLIQTELSLAETELFVTLAADIDDGDAQVLAIASSRGLTAASDDRRAQRKAIELGVRVIGTAELVLRWAPTVAPEAAAEAVRRIEARAHYFPSPAHPLREEWDRRRA